MLAYVENYAYTIRFPISHFWKGSYYLQQIGDGTVPLQIKKVTHG